MNRYEKTEQGYNFYLGEDLLFKLEKPYLLLDLMPETKSFVILKHGKKTVVQETYDLYKSRIPEDKQTFFKLVIFDMCQLSIEEMNKILNNTGYFPEPFKRDLFNLKFD